MSNEFETFSSQLGETNVTLDYFTGGKNMSHAYPYFEYFIQMEYKPWFAHSNGVQTLVCTFIQMVCTFSFKCKSRFALQNIQMQIKICTPEHSNGVQTLVCTFTQMNVHGALPQIPPVSL